jgi:hypothetical protein
MSAAEEAVRADPWFRELVARLANRVVCWAMMDFDRTQPVDRSVDNQLLDIAARLTVVACAERACPADLELARAVLDVAWKLTPAVRKTGDEFANTVAVRAEPWQIALNKVFEQQTFIRVPVDGAPSRRARDLALEGVARILAQLADSGAALPTNLGDAARLFHEGTSAVELPSPTRERVDRAARFIEALLRASTPEGPVELRVGWEKLGGRGPGRRLSPWGAASEFAKAFDLRMAERLHDVTRDK